MPPIDPNIQDIEQYLDGQMDQAGKLAFEERLHQDFDLQKEVKAYRGILEGFSALRAEAFTEHMANWEEEIDLETEETLEKYLRGELQGEAKGHLDHQLAADPALAARADQLRSLLGGFQALQADEFSSKLQQWEKEEEKENTHTKVRSLRPRLFRQIAVAAGFLLIILVGLRWFGQANYSNQVLVETYYQPVATGGTLGNEGASAEQIDQRFEEAHQALRSGDYREAIASFQEVINLLPEVSLDAFTRNYYYDNATFNLALALLGAEAPEAEVQAALQKVIENPDSDHLTEAMQLQHQLGSFWRKVGR